MGLDITAYRRVERCDPQPSDEEADQPENWDRLHNVWSNPHFAKRQDGLEDGWYTAAESMGFRAGSYSGFNRWREWLSQAMLGAAPEEVWKSPESFGPFVELIHMSDCEGFIGPKTSAKLAADFAAHEPTGDAADDQYSVEKYQTWREAFEMAADGGLVKFH